MSNVQPQSKVRTSKFYIPMGRTPPHPKAILKRLEVQTLKPIWDSAP